MLKGPGQNMPHRHKTTGRYFSPSRSVLASKQSHPIPLGWSNVQKTEKPPGKISKPKFSTKIPQKTQSCCRSRKLAVWGKIQDTGNIRRSGGAAQSAPPSTVSWLLIGCSWVSCSHRPPPRWAYRAMDPNYCNSGGSVWQVEEGWKEGFLQHNQLGWRQRLRTGSVTQINWKSPKMPVKKDV